MHFEFPNNLTRTLRFRLTVWYTLVLIVALGVALFAVRQGTRIALLHETDQRLREDLDELSLVVRTKYPDLQAISEEFDRKSLAHNTHGMFLHLADGTGRFLVGNHRAPLTDLPFDLQAETLVLQTREGVSSAQGSEAVRTVRARFTAVNGETLYLRIGTSLVMNQTVVNHITSIMLAVIGVMLLISPLGGYYLASRATRPLAAINAMARKLQPTRLGDRLPLRGSNDELDELSQQINGLLDRIAQFVERNRTFTANAAHELRSPLAAIQSTVEVALNEERTLGEYQELLETIVSECGNLRVLVNQLLLISENDAETLPINFQMLTLADLVRRSIEMFHDTAEEQGIQLSAAALDPVTVWGDPKRLRQVLNNLIDNGLKFNQRGGRVQISVRGKPGDAFATLTVSDSGQGIPATDLSYVFERFFRGDKSHSREQAASSDLAEAGMPRGPAGNGLGLSICQAIVAAHQGTIKVSSQIGVGTTFTVILPTTPAANSNIPAGSQALAPASVLAGKG